MVNFNRFNLRFTKGILDSEASNQKANDEDADEDNDEKYVLTLVVAAVVRSPAEDTSTIPSTPARQTCPFQS